MFKFSGKYIDLQVMGSKNKSHMGLGKTTLTKAILYDKPLLNIVYTPQTFQIDRDSFGSDYLFTVPVAENVPVLRSIPYEAMKPPTVYISLGSIISNRGFCKECIRAFGNKEISVILNTGRIDPASLGEMPGNIYAYSLVPQIEVLRHADVFLTHCGMNSVNEAMACGVPMVAMPFINDQISNAGRIVELGIGKRVRSFPSSGRRLYKTVMAVYQDTHMRNKAKEIQELLKNETNLSDVVSRIEMLLA